VVKTGSVAAVGDGVTSGESVSGGDEWDAQETSGDTSTPARRVTIYVQ